MADDEVGQVGGTASGKCGLGKVGQVSWLEWPSACKLPVPPPFADLPPTRPAAPADTCPTCRDPPPARRPI